MKFKTKTILILLAFTLFCVINIDTSYANYSIQEENINQLNSNDYLDFSYISFVIQTIIGGAVAGTVALIAYHRKLSNFIFNLFNKNKDEDN